jgi:hypothetical protein
MDTLMFIWFSTLVVSYITYERIRLDGERCKAAAAEAEAATAAKAPGAATDGAGAAVAGKKIS